MDSEHKAKGSFSVFPADQYWYIACETKTLGAEPLSVKLWDRDLVLFRDKAGTPHCLLDRCAHRNVPLSEGRCQGGTLQCPYHGWEYDGSGACTKVPALPNFEPGQAHRVPAFSVEESQGYVWIYTKADQAPHCRPYRFPFLENKGYIHVRYQADFEASLHATAENILDVPHTAFLHKGLFRGGEPNGIETEIRAFGDRVECEFIGEPRPSGLLGKILAPGGGDQMFHCDRFLLPSVAQVEYRMGHRGHLLTTSSLSPISDFQTRLYAVVSVRKSFWLSLLRPVITPLAMKVVQQDQEVLAKQTAAIQAHGGEHYAYTEADTLGPGIIRLLRRAVKEAIPTTVGDETVCPELGEPESVDHGKIWA